eukprot:Selendium_serpulae@DN6549_c0_g1_i1.p1
MASPIRHCRLDKIRIKAVVSSPDAPPLGAPRRFRIVQSSLLPTAFSSLVPVSYHLSNGFLRLDAASLSIVNSTNEGRCAAMRSRNVDAHVSRQTLIGFDELRSAE